MGELTPTQNTFVDRGDGRGGCCGNQQFGNCGGGCCGYQQFEGCGCCTPYSCYSGCGYQQFGNCGWQSGPCGCNTCCNPCYSSCYPCGNPFWSFGCNSCGKGKQDRKKDCKVKVITQGRI